MMLHPWALVIDLKVTETGEGDYVDKLRSISIELNRARIGLELAGDNMLAGSTGFLPLSEGNGVLPEEPRLP